MLQGSEMSHVPEFSRNNLAMTNVSVFDAMLSLYRILSAILFIPLLTNHES